MDVDGNIRLVMLRHALSKWWQDPTAIPSFMKWIAENTRLRADMNFKGVSEGRHEVWLYGDIQCQRILILSRTRQF